MTDNNPNIATARGPSAVVLSYFQLRNPDSVIRSEVRAGLDTLNGIIAERVSRRAVLGDGCECAVSRGLRDDAQNAHLGFIDVFTYKHYIYALVLCDDDSGELEMVKYRHTGSDIVSTLDSGNRVRGDRWLTLKPCEPHRRPGANTRRWRDRPDRPRREPQSVATITKRQQTLTSGASVMRLKNAARRVAEFTG